MSCDCGCCAGIRATTPVTRRNRPGLARIDHRPGTYASFIETMRARLSSADFPELAALKTRADDDASIALCDAWAVAADVLAFYQNRVANEGYLRTATERRSLLELGRLTGYEMRPGVSASVYLAYDIDPNSKPVDIPIGTRAQSVPAPGETMQTFETAEPLNARAEWSRIRVRLSQPQWRSPGSGYGERYNVLKTPLYLQGTTTQLKANDALLIAYDDNTRIPYRVDSVTTDTDKQRTIVRVREWNAQGAGAARAPKARSTLATLVGQLARPVRAQPRNALALARNVGATLRTGGDVYSRLLLAHVPALATTLYPALRSIDVTDRSPQPVEVHALRTKAALFGNNAPDPVPAIEPANIVGIARRAPAATASFTGSVFYSPLSVNLAWGDLGLGDPIKVDELETIPLDATYEQVKPTSGKADPSWVVVDLGGTPNAPPDPLVLDVQAIQVASMSIRTGFSARVSQLTVKRGWLSTSAPGTPIDLATPDLLRRTQVFAQSELLPLAADPLEEDIISDQKTTPEIELDAFYDGLQAGQWLIAGGERADLDDTDAKVNVAERAMIAAVRQGLTVLEPASAADGRTAANLPGDTLHTFVTLAKPLTYSYKREALALYGNVVRATHGETRRETLGAGDATQVFQAFPLKSPPLTYVAAPTPQGVASTLQVRVNTLRWNETDGFNDSGAHDRAYLTRRDESEKTTVVFGDGKHGARLPSGLENVSAVYRSGIGKAGNVKDGQLTLATDKPLGVKGVTNPIRASGGAGADTLAQARENAPLAVTALDRLVSVQDYADFARGFAGIGKAASIKLPGPGGEFVHVTVAGIDDEPIDESSDLFGNLVEALRDFGDPHLPIRAQVREALSLVIQARIVLLPDYAWEDVEPRVRSALLDRFGFQARDLAQPLFQSGIIGVVQGVRGVAHVLDGTARTLSLDQLIAGLAAAPADAPGNRIAPSGDANTSRALVGANGWLDVASARITDATSGATAPAQIAYLPADVPDALLLELAS